MSKLPNFSQCRVPDTKLTGYLLAAGHADGGSKAKFLKAFGFSPDSPDELKRAILDHAETCDIADSRSTEFGIIFEVGRPMLAPDGRSPFVRVVWMIDTGTKHPRLITLVPAKEDAR